MRRWKECAEEALLLAIYLISALAFHVILAKYAPSEVEPALSIADSSADCEVIELFADHADRAASRAA